MYGSLQSVWMVSSAAGWAVSDHEILRYSNGSWSVQARQDYLHSVEMLSDDDGWAVCRKVLPGSPNPIYQPVIFHYDGKRWTEVSYTA